MTDSVDSGGNTPAASAPSGPTTFAEAFAADASPASDPSTQTTTPETAAQSPDAPEVSPQQDDRSPWIPRQRFDDVHGRMKTAEERLKAYAWAEGVDPQAFQALKAWQDRAAADPDNFWIDEAHSLGEERALTLANGLIQRLQQTPAGQAAIRSFAGRLMAQQRAAQPQAEPEIPSFLVPQADGTVGVDLQAMPKFIEAIERRAEARARAAMDAELNPIKQRHQEQEQTTQRLAQEAAVERFAEGASQDFFKWPGMDNLDLRNEVIAEFGRRVGPIKGLSNEQLLLELHRVHQTVIPKLRAHSESQMLDSLQQKAHAGAGVTPGRGGPAPAADIKSFKDRRLTW